MAFRDVTITFTMKYYVDVLQQYKFDIYFFQIVTTCVCIFNATLIDCTNYTYTFSVFFPELRFKSIENGKGKQGDHDDAREITAV